MVKTPTNSWFRVGRTPWSAANPLIGLCGLSSLVKSAIRGPRVDQGVRPTFRVERWHRL